jgi:hypothetical protein
MRFMRSRVSTLFAVIARRLPIDWNAAAPDRDRGAKEALQANFAAIVLNGLSFPTAGKNLSAGLLLTWFVMTPATPSLHEKHERLWLLVISPIIRAAHLLRSTTAIWCAKFALRDCSLAPVRWAIARDVARYLRALPTEEPAAGAVRSP